jgi:hypothetical protein
MTSSKVEAKLIDAAGDAIDFDDGKLPISTTPNTNQIIDYNFFQIAAFFTIASDITINDYQFTAVGGHSITPGQTVVLVEGTRIFQAVATAVATNLITVDSPIDFAFTAAGCDGRNGAVDMAVSASQASPEIFRILAPPTEKWLITRVIFVVEDDVAMDTAKFGGITALVNGVVLRVVQNSRTTKLFNIKTNGDFAIEAYDVSYDDKAPAGTFGIRTRRTFASDGKNGAFIELDGNLGETLEIIIQDDLSALTKFVANAQGRVK